jgi:hypothetical protein
MLYENRLKTKRMKEKERSHALIQNRDFSFFDTALFSHMKRRKEKTASQKEMNEI